MYLTHGGSAYPSGENDIPIVFYGGHVTHVAQFLVSMLAICRVLFPFCSGVDSLPLNYQILFRTYRLCFKNTI